MSRASLVPCTYAGEALVNITRRGAVVDVGVAVVSRGGGGDLDVLH